MPETKQLGMNNYEQDALFKQRLKCTHFVSSTPASSHPLAMQTPNCFLCVVLEVAVRCLGHVNKQLDSTG